MIHIVLNVLKICTVAYRVINFKEMFISARIEIPYYKIKYKKYDMLCFCKVKFHICNCSPITVDWKE